MKKTESVSVRQRHQNHGLQARFLDYWGLLLALTFLVVDNYVVDSARSIDSSKNMRQIGQELGVAAILEGGVRRIGNTVRINVQLIDAETDERPCG